MYGDRAKRGQRRIACFLGEQTDVDSDIRGQRRNAGREDARSDEIRVARVLAALASRQDGVVARAQLIARGISRDVIDRLVADGTLIPLLRGVYAVGHRAIGERGWMRAALLAAGPFALLSHGTAARGWVLVPRFVSPAHVIVVGREPRSRPGLQIHTVRELHPSDRGTHQDLPLTQPGADAARSRRVGRPPSCSNGHCGRRGCGGWSVRASSMRRSTVHRSSTVAGVVSMP